MRQDDLRTHELDDDSREHSAQPDAPGKPPTRRAAALAPVAALLVVALIGAVLVTLSARQPTHGAVGNVATGTPATSLAATTTPAPAFTQGAGLPEGVEIITFTLTGPD